MVIKEATIASFGWKSLFEVVATAILFLTSLSVSKIYNWQYSGLASSFGISDPIR
jgi:hypothetical protein